MYNIPSQDFLKHLSLIQCIPSNWKTNLKREKRDYPDGESILQNLLKVKQTNKYVYNMLLKKEEIEISKAEQNGIIIFQTNILIGRKYTQLISLHLMI